MTADCPGGRHVRRGKGRELEWNVPFGGDARTRVLDWTCPCGQLVYELCASGGRLFIRQATTSADEGVVRTVVLESERWVAKRGNEVWAELLDGRVW